MITLPERVINSIDSVMDRKQRAIVIIQGGGGREQNKNRGRDETVQKGVNSSFHPPDVCNVDEVWAYTQTSSDTPADTVMRTS